MAHTGVALFTPAQLFADAPTQEMQVFCAPQSGVVPPQSLSVSQATQAPLLPQTGFVESRAAHAALLLQATQAFLLQKDFSAVLQSPSPLHSTQAWFVASQTGLAPVHALAFMLVHSTQVSADVLQAGLTPLQVWSSMHATHVCVVRSQAVVPVLFLQSSVL